MSSDERTSIQLRILNERWSDAVAHIPHYREIVGRGHAPPTFASLEAFVEMVPPLDRASVRELLPRLIDPRRPPDRYRVTGGSTGEPLSVPHWREEFLDSEANMWAARASYDVTPASRAMLLWGHSHLFGAGIAGRVRRVERGLRDRAVGYRRVSAYDLDHDALRAAGDELIRFRPDYVIGYAGALDAFVRVNTDRQERFAELSLRTVIATAEALPRSDSRDVISAVLGCPVAIEYGATETGLIAHSRPRQDGLEVFWRQSLVEVGEAGEDGRGDLRVTSLFPRVLPLFRYALGDRAAGLGDGVTIGADRLRDVAGRTGGMLRLTDGTSVNSLLFDHALRPESSVVRYQIVVEPLGTQLLLLCDEDEELRSRVLRRLVAANPGLQQVKVRCVKALHQTRAGKTPLVHSATD